MSQVYFLAAPSVNLIKIGRSVEPEARFEALRLLSPVPLEVIGLLPGGHDLETRLHRQFLHLKSHGEWFHAAEELRHFIWRETLMTIWHSGPPEWQMLLRLKLDTPVMDAA